jgi:prepilin-type N-terminal cleavage/methylation domain-containing protein
MEGSGIMKDTGSKKRQRGFTFIEIMISLALIGISLIVIIQSVNFHSDVMRKNMLKTRLYQIAREKLYELKRDMTPSSGTTEDGFFYKTEIIKTKDSDYIIVRAFIEKDKLNASLFEFIPSQENGERTEEQ